MSTPNPVNLNNLDTRYITPGQVDTKIATQATTDAGQYVTQTTAGYTTRSAAYSFGGGANSTSIPGSLSLAVRYRFSLSQSLKRLRVRYRNYDGLHDGAGYTAGPVQIGKTYIGSEQSGSPLTYATSPQLVDASGTGVGTIAGTTEYVTPWLTPTAGSLKAGTTLILSHEITNPSGSAVTVGGSGTAGGYANIDHTAVNATSNSGYASFAVVPCEIILEYEFASPAKIGLFIGHSFVDSYSASKEGWWGQHTGFPQQWARRTGNIAVVNAYPSSYAGSDWGSSSQKWSRFPTVTPDFVFVSLIANDILAGASTSTTQSAYTTVIQTIHTKYPNTPVYSCIETPYGAASASSIEATRLAVNTWLPTVTDTLDIAGILDFDRVLRDNTNANLIAANYLSTDNLHPKIRGYMVIADLMTSIR